MVGTGRVGGRMGDQPWVAPGSSPGAVPPPPGYAGPPPGAPPSPPGYAGGPSPRGPYVAGLEFRPGIIPLRPLRLGDIYGGVIKAVRGNVAATMGLALLTSIVCLVPATALGAWVASLETADFDSAEGGFIGSLGSNIPTLGSLVASIALTGFLAYVIGQAVLGRKVGIGETWDGSKRRLWAVAGAVLITTFGGLLLLAVIFGPPIAWLVSAGEPVLAPILLLVLGGFVAILGSLFLWTRFAFVTSVIVLEQRGVFSAFARSWRLTSGSEFWRILGIRLLTSLIVGFAAAILTIPFSLGVTVLVVVAGDIDHLYVWQTVLSGVAALVSGAITTPFSAGVDALMTVDQRIRREGLDVQLIHAAQTGGAAPWPSAATPR